MKTVKDIVIEFLNENEASSLDVIFDKVVEEMQEHWETMYPKEKMPKFLISKKAELYTLLITDGHFLLLEDTTWDVKTKYSLDEQNMLKIHVNEVDELDKEASED